jgi:hypothetical protein
MSLADVEAVVSVEATTPSSSEGAASSAHDGSTKPPKLTAINEQHTFLTIFTPVPSASISHRACGLKANPPEF